MEKAPAFAQAMHALNIHAPEPTRLRPAQRDTLFCAPPLLNVTGGPHLQVLRRLFTALHTICTTIEHCAAATAAAAAAAADAAAAATAAASCRRPWAAVLAEGCES